MSLDSVQDQIAHYASGLVAESGTVGSMRITVWYDSESDNRLSVGRPFNLGYRVTDVYGDDYKTYSRVVTPGEEAADYIQQTLVNDDVWRTLFSDQLRELYRDPFDPGS